MNSTTFSASHSIVSDVLSTFQTIRSKKRRRMTTGWACKACRGRKIRCNVPSCGSPCTNCRYYEVDCIRPPGHRQQNSRDPVERCKNECCSQQRDQARALLWNTMDKGGTMADSNQKPYTNKSTSLEQSQQCYCELSGLRPCPLCETKSEINPVTSSEEFPIAVGISSSAWAAPATNFDFFGLCQDLEDVISAWTAPAIDFDFFGLSQDLEDVILVWSSGSKTLYEDRV